MENGHGNCISFENEIAVLFNLNNIYTYIRIYKTFTALRQLFFSNGLRIIFYQNTAKKNPISQDVKYN